MASHPYGYDIYVPFAAQGYPYSFPNYYGIGGTYQGACFDLNSLVTGWNANAFPNIVHVATEDNYDSLPPPAPPATYPAIQTVTDREGAYLMDLATWMWWNLGQSSELQYPFEVMWFSGFDSPSHWTNGPGSQPTAGDALLGLLDFFVPVFSGPPYGADNKAIAFAPSCTGLSQIGNGSHLPDIMAAVAPGGARC